MKKLYAYFLPVLLFIIAGNLSAKATTDTFPSGSFIINMGGYSTDYRQRFETLWTGIYAGKKSSCAGKMGYQQRQVKRWNRLHS